MEDFVRFIEGCWFFRLLSILSSLLGVIAGIIAIVGALVVWYTFVKRYSSLPKLKKSDGQPIVLGVQHCESPSEPELKGKQVVVTGIIRVVDSQARSFELHAFPFSVRVTIVCELGADDGARLNPLDLVSVIGTADDNIKHDDSRCRLHLKHCQVRRPAFSDRIRHWLVNGPIGGPIRQWWSFGWM